MTHYEVCRSPMPFGCEGVWLVLHRGETDGHAFVSPMPFGCEGVWLTPSIVHITGNGIQSPMPFGCEGVWLRSNRSRKTSPLLCLQCLSAVRGFGCEELEQETGEELELSPMPFGCEGVWLPSRHC